MDQPHGSQEATYLKPSRLTGMGTLKHNREGWGDGVPGSPAGTPGHAAG